MDTKRQQQHGKAKGTMEACTMYTCVCVCVCVRVGSAGWKHNGWNVAWAVKASEPTLTTSSEFRLQRLSCYDVYATEGGE